MQEFNLDYMRTMLTAVRLPPVRPTCAHLARTATLLTSQAAWKRSCSASRSPWKPANGGYVGVAVIVERLELPPQRRTSTSFRCCSAALSSSANLQQHVVEAQVSCAVHASADRGHNAFGVPSIYSIADVLLLPTVCVLSKAACERPQPGLVSTGYSMRKK